MRHSLSPPRHKNRSSNCQPKLSAFVASHESHNPLGTKKVIHSRTSTSNNKCSPEACPSTSHSTNHSCKRYTSPLTPLKLGKSSIFKTHEITDDDGHTMADGDKSADRIGASSQQTDPWSQGHTHPGRIFPTWKDMAETKIILLSFL